MTTQLKITLAAAMLSLPMMAVSAVSASAAEHASGDAAAGEDAYRQCRACHSLINAEGEAIVRGGKTGPNQWGLPGRQAGTDEDFARYGEDLVAAGEAGLVWNEEEFVAYVQDPAGYLQEYLDDDGARSLMSYKVRSEEDAVNLWAYIASVSPEPETDGEEPES